MLEETERWKVSKSPQWLPGQLDIQWYAWYALAEDWYRFPRIDRLLLVSILRIAKAMQLSLSLSLCLSLSLSLSGRCSAVRPCRHPLTISRMSISPSSRHLSSGEKLKDAQTARVSFASLRAWQRGHSREASSAPAKHLPVPLRGECL